MDEIKVPIYLMTGFLESGKTSFLSFTIQQDYFHTDGKTLLILCEEGEEEYDPAGRLIEYSEYKFENGLRTEKNVYDPNKKLKSRKFTYVQVRAFAKDSTGQKVYGKFSAKKKVFIK